MIDIFAAKGTFADIHKLAVDAAAIVKAIEKVLVEPKLRTRDLAGTANTVAANPLNRIPSFMKNPRREILTSLDGAMTGLVDISELLALRVIGSGIRPPGVLRAA